MRKEKASLGKKWSVLGLVLMMATLFVGFLQSNVMAEKCPAGSLNADKELDSIAECNLDTGHAGSSNLMGTINTIISVVLGVLGIVAVIMIIYGGFMYTTAAGDAAKVKKAKDTIMYGVIGLVVALLAFAIVNFVLTSVFKGTTTSSSDNSGGPGAAQVSQ